jgi:hypothetical protein
MIGVGAGPDFYAYITGLMARLPDDLAWLVAFDVSALREATDDDVLRAAWFLPAGTELPDGAAVVLTSAGTAVVARGHAEPHYWSGEASWPVADGMSLFDRYRDRLEHLGQDGVLCVGVGHAADGPPVAMTVGRSAGAGPNAAALVRAAFDTPPDTEGYELLAGCGVRYEGTRPSGPFHVATFRNRISAHLTAALGSAFARTENCNYFFFRGARLDARLQEGLIQAGEARLRTGAAMAQISAVNLALVARRMPMAMTAVPPPPEAPQPMGDLVPIGLLLHALRGGGDDIPGVAAAATLLERHLDRHRQHGLWSFQSGRLITATDSALVLLGRRDPEAVARLEQFADGTGGYLPQHVIREPVAEEHGPGRMVLTHANRHWTHPDFGTTLVVRALRRGAGMPTKTSLAYIVERFETRGALYFANPFLLDWLLAEALADDPDAADLRARLGDEIAASVNADMSFGTWDRGLSTACAILALAALGRRGRLTRCAQLRLLDLVDATGQPEPCTPFYSTLRSEPGDDGMGLIPDRPGVLRVEGQRHDLTLYHDTHRIIGTALRLLALQQVSDPMLRDLPDDQARAARHERYACPDVASYVRGFALPPYLGEPPARPAAAGGMDGLLRATFARYRPEPFVDAASLARMIRLGRSLPGAATAFFGFECRLGGAPPEADFLVCVGRDDGGPAALAAGLENAPPGPSPFWGRLAAFCRRWTDPGEPWHDLVSNVWLEFDLAGTADNETPPVPAIFIGTKALVAGAGHATADRISDALDALAGSGPSLSRRVALHRVLDALPAGGSVFQLGVMLSRGDDRVRACVSGLAAPALDRYLTTLGLPDPDGSRAAFLADVGPVCAEIRAGLDATADGIGPRVGFECYGGDTGPRWLALLHWLHQSGLASHTEIQALLAWEGLQHSRLLRDNWPAWTDGHPARPSEGGAGALWRSLNHVKVTLDPALPMAAKAYLASRLVWPTEQGMRDLVAARAAAA